MFWFKVCFGSNIEFCFFLFWDLLGGFLESWEFWIDFVGIIVEY